MKIMSALKGKKICLFYCLIAGLWLILKIPGYGQTLIDTPLQYPWAGGLNSCQFGNIDINLDGKKDLVIFDRHGNRILPFINLGIPDSVSYSFHPELAFLFPDIHDWVIFRDYDCDGKEDIFTYGLGSIRVFHNISDSILKFELITVMIESYYYTGKIGILVTPVDYPAIADMDLDGDQDILTFFGLGSYLEYHKNLSIEKNGNCDSLDYRLSDKCWGNFMESASSNKITLGISCPYKNSTSGISCNNLSDATRHTGSTLLITDLNGDGVQDLILGDVDYPGLIALTNGGTKDSANMISQDTLFPSNSKPVHLFSFPCASLIDINNDGKNDLIVSPFDPNLVIAENFKSVWYYRNTGTNLIPDFQFVTDRFFQSDMIDVGTNSFPVLCDINGDGLIDLLIGNFGYYDTSYYYQAVLHSEYISKLAYYKNTGTLYNPVFHLVTNDFADLSALKLKGIYPTFGDLDGDGSIDMIIGNSDSTLIFFRNTASPHQEPVYAKPQLHYQNIKTGAFSTPQLFDLDRDGLSDLIIGEQKGKLNYFKNKGNATNPSFSLVTDSLGMINVTNDSLSYYGYSTPCFFRDNDGKTKLLVGSDEGKVHYFTNIDNNLEGQFTESDSLYLLVGSPIQIRSGWRTSAAIGHLTDPQLMDLVVGNYSGGLNYYSNKSQPQVISSIRDHQESSFVHFSIYPNPADQFVNGSVNPGRSSGSIEVSIIDITGKAILKTQTGYNFRLSLSSIPSGFYFLKAANSIQKLIIFH